MGRRSLLIWELTLTEVVISMSAILGGVALALNHIVLSMALFVLFLIAYGNIINISREIQLFPFWHNWFK